MDEDISAINTSNRNTKIINFINKNKKKNNSWNCNINFFNF